MKSLTSATQPERRQCDQHQAGQGDAGREGWFRRVTGGKSPTGALGPEALIERSFGS